MPPQGQAFVKQLLKERRGCSVEMCFEPSAIGKNKQQQQKKQGLQKQKQKQRQKPGVMCVCPPPKNMGKKR
jgi:hypothetical protein